MTQFVDLITEVRDEIIEPLTGLVSDPEIKRWLNDANRDLVNAITMEAGGLVKSTPHTFDTLAGDEWYDLPADCGIILRVERQSTDGNSWRGLIPTSIQGRSEIDLGVPTSFYVFGEQIGLVPTPNDVYHMRIFHHVKPVDMVDDADLPQPDAQYHRLLYLYATSQAKRKADDTAYQTYVSDYLAGRTQMVRNIILQKQTNQGFPMVRDVG